MQQMCASVSEMHVSRRPKAVGGSNVPKRSEFPAQRRGQRRLGVPNTKECAYQVVFSDRAVEDAASFDEDLHLGNQVVVDDGTESFQFLLSITTATANVEKGEKSQGESRRGG